LASRPLFDPPSGVCPFFLFLPPQTVPRNLSFFRPKPPFCPHPDFSSFSPLGSVGLHSPSHGYPFFPEFFFFILSLSQFLWSLPMFSSPPDVLTVFFFFQPVFFIFSFLFHFFLFFSSYLLFFLPSPPVSFIFFLPPLFLSFLFFFFFFSFYFVLLSFCFSFFSFISFFLSPLPLLYWLYLFFFVYGLVTTCLPNKPPPPPPFPHAPPFFDPPRLFFFSPYS